MRKISKRKDSASEIDNTKRGMVNTSHSYNKIMGMFYNQKLTNMQMIQHKKTVAEKNAFELHI